MNRLPENSVFRAITGIARAQCANHRRDDIGWPLGNCVECHAFRKQMDAWHMAQVMDGNHDPDLIDNRTEETNVEGVA